MSDHNAQRSPGPSHPPTTPSPPPHHARLPPPPPPSRSHCGGGPLQHHWAPFNNRPRLATISDEGSIFPALAQLVSAYPHTVEVTGSSPVPPTRTEVSPQSVLGLRAGGRQCGPFQPSQNGQCRFVGDEGESCTCPSSCPPAPPAHGLRSGFRRARQRRRGSGAFAFPSPPMPPSQARSHADPSRMPARICLSGTDGRDPDAQFASFAPPPFARTNDCKSNRRSRFRVFRPERQPLRPRGRSGRPGRVQQYAIVEDCGLPDLQVWDAPQVNIQDLPQEALQFLLASRYCEVDSELKEIAWRLFSQTKPGWPRVQAVCDFVHEHIHFDYQQARANRTAQDVFRERAGVCRDYMHLAITFCRCLNVPARYCTGYLGDIGVPEAPYPMDFGAWFEAFLGGQWYAFDARNNVPRIGRVLMAHGRDAADVALTTTFGVNQLKSFQVWTHEVATNSS